eukprot:gene13177-17655_t
MSFMFRQVEINYKYKLYNNFLFSTSKTIETYNKFTVVSFFKFVSIQSNDIERIVKCVKTNLSSIGAKGTLLVSSEGFSGQFAVQENSVNETSLTLPKLSAILLSCDSNIFANIDMNVGNRNSPTIDTPFPYKKLLVKEKKEILTDGIDALDWDNNGDELPPEVWHEELSGINTKESNSNSQKAILIDCRNQYESELGTFQGAVPLNTSTFSDSWPVLDSLLKDLPKESKIYTFCTGGIRCVKTNAYIKQKLGFQNIYRLKKGIIGYEKWVNDGNNNLQEQENISNNNSDNNEIEMISGSERTSLFVGKNFLFDRRRLPSGVEQYKNEK